jgi:hypothetical protein
MASFPPSDQPSLWVSSGEGVGACPCSPDLRLYKKPQEAHTLASRHIRPGTLHMACHCGWWPVVER